MPALVRLLPMLLGAALLLVHGALWFAGLRRASARSRAIEAYYAGDLN